MLDSSDFPKWDNSNPTESLQLVYTWAINNTQKHINWYKTKKKPKRIGSRLLRGFSIILASMGALCPLIDATGVLNIIAENITLGQWGYVLLAVAAAIVGFDRYFGMSTGWMRYTITQMSIERALEEFQYDWIILFAQQPIQQSHGINMQEMLQSIKEFTQKVENLTKQETDSWVVEFRNNIAELDKLLKAEVETRKHGSIKVKVNNAAEFSKITIFLNDNKIRDFSGVSEGLIDDIPPKSYEVKAIGTKNNKKYRESKVVEVQPNAMSSVELTLS